MGKQTPAALPTPDERLYMRIIRIDPKRIKLLDVNAHFMRHETFMRLVQNIRRDGVLTSIPFGWLLHDDDGEQNAVKDADGEPVFEVLSGNHRVQAAIAAGLTEIDFLVTSDYIPPARRKAIQLSHNAIHGEDDPELLRLLYGSIDDIELKLYSGLDDKQLDLLGEAAVEGLSEANLDFQTISMVFLPDEVEEARAVWEAAKKAIAGSKGAWLLRCRIMTA